jgi:hypothetical protein
MKKLAILMVLVAFLTASCTKKDGTTDKPQCVAGELLVVGVTPAIAKELQCTGQTAMRDDLLRVVQGSKLCAPEPDASASPTAMNFSVINEANAFEFPIFSTTLCGFFGGLIVDTLVQKAVPATWGCSAQVARDKVKAIVEGACNQIKK